MTRLRILGTPGLESPGGDSAYPLLSQPKRLALLAYLAVKGDRLTTRDAILVMFWPEQTEERARHALSQSLYVLRRELGDGAIVTRGHALGIDPDRLRCDAVQFEQSLRTGDRSRALELYRGPLLDGFFLAESPEFERWLEETRADLHTQAARAAGRLADEASARSDPAAVELARRAAELAPHDEASAARLIALLDKAGDRSRAVATYEEFARRLQADCQLKPSATLVALIAAIRSRPVPEALAVVAAWSDDVALPAEPAPLLQGRPRWTGLRRAAMSAAAVAALAFVARAVPKRSSGQHTSIIGNVAAPGRVAVLPFTVSGKPADTALGRDLVELLTTRIDSAGLVHAVPADTVLQVLDGAGGRSGLTNLGTSSVVEGEVRLLGGELHLRAAWRRLNDHALLAEATMEGPVDSLFNLLDALAVELLAETQRSPDRALARAAAQAHPALAAYKLWLAGDDALAHGRFTAAARAFERAVTADSSFALARYRLGVAALWAEDYPLAAADAGSRALSLSTGLADHDRRLIAGFDAWRRGMDDSARTLLRGVIAVMPDNLEAWFQLGETWFHYNPVNGNPVAQAHEAFMQVLRLDPDHWGALWHLAMLDGLEGRVADLDHRLDRLLVLGPDTDYRLEIVSLRACAHRDSASLARLAPELRQAGEGRIIDLAWRCAVFGRDLAGAETIAQVMLERVNTPFAIGSGRLLLADLEMARGRRNRALAQLDSSEQVDLVNALNLRTTFALLPLHHPTDGEFDRLLAEWRRAPNVDVAGVPLHEPDHRRSISVGRLEVALGHNDTARQIAAALDRDADLPSESGLSHALAEEIRALASSGEGDSLGAMRRFEDSRPSIWFGVQVSSAVGSRSSARFEQGEAFERMGRLSQALGWYASLDELSIPDLVYSAPAHWRRAGVFERQGDQVSAAREYRRFIELWNEADPELQEWVAEARRRIATRGSRAKSRAAVATAVLPR